MSAKLIEAARARRVLAIEKKRVKDELRRLRHARTANKPVPYTEIIRVQPPAA